MDPIGEVASKLEVKVASFVKGHRLAGAAAGIVYGDSLAWFGGTGFADIAARRVPSHDAVSRRVDHEDLHGHRHPAVARRGEAPSG